MQKSQKIKLVMYQDSLLIIEKRYFKKERLEGLLLSSVAEPPLFWAPDGQGPGADSGSDLLG